MFMRKLLLFLGFNSVTIFVLNYFYQQFFIRDISYLQEFFLLLFFPSIIFFYIFLKIGSMYHFLHELSHWVMAKIFRRKTRGFQFNQYGGKVDIANPNELIILAPYIFPVITYLLLLLFIVVKVFFPLDGFVVNSFYLFLVFSFSVHLVFTLKVLSYEQTDIKFVGKILAYSMILSGNLFLFLFIFSLAS